VDTSGRLPDKCGCVLAPAQTGCLCCPLLEVLLGDVLIEGLLVDRVLRPGLDLGLDELPAGAGAFTVEQLGLDMLIGMLMAWLRARCSPQCMPLTPKCLSAYASSS